MPSIPPSMPLALSPVHQAASEFPQQIAIKLAEQDISYQVLSQRIIALGEQLTAAGLTPNEPFACVSSNNLEMICLYWACVDIGAIFFPISPRFPIAQVQALIYTHQIRYYWAPTNSALQDCHHLALNFEPISTGLAPSVDFTRPANVILTSGSCGAPKAAVHCLANHIANADGARRLITLAQGDAWLLSLPLFHIGGLAILNRCALVGASIVMPDRTLSLSQQIERDKLTHVSLVPTQLSQLLNDKNNEFNSIKALLLGGGAIPVDLLDRLQQRNIASYTSYGMTEMASQITTGPTVSDGSSGQLLPLRELKIVDGVIWIRGACLFMGYHSPEGIDPAIDELGWFYTKDRGEWDENGNLKILGRVDNMFICGGENVQPEEIEAALKQHAQIDDAIVFAEPDSQFGHLPAAIIRGSLTQHPTAIAHEMEQFLVDRIARFKRPRHYYVWPENIPQTGLKVNRQDLIATVTLKPLRI